jgi:hypothetical protein
MQTSFSDKSPEYISNLCWNAMLTKYNYFNFLQCSHLKALGDSTQELNGALKYGGYTSPGIRMYTENESSATAPSATVKKRKKENVNINIYFNSIPASDSRTNTSTSEVLEIDAGNIEPYDAGGDALRGTLSNDRQAGPRSIWLLTCLPPNVINNKAFGGYSGPKANTGDFVLAVADPTMNSQISATWRTSCKT